uniref:Uncharacterized protein n=1 Tax=Arundo donax TaxID=35708 RepID=A0A0A9AZA6_ARUDO
MSFLYVINLFLVHLCNQLLVVNELQKYVES